jgi:hypothetical protein
MNRLPFLSTCGTLALAVAMGCSDSDGTGGNAGGADPTSTSTGTGAGGGGDGGAPSTFELALHVDTIPYNRIGPWSPCDAAEVVVTLGDETELRGTTDPQGNVTLAVPDGLEAQPADLVIFKAEHGWVAYPDQDLTDLNIKIVLYGPTELNATASGGVVGVLDPSHALGVYPTRSYDFYQGAQPSWSVQVPSQEPITLFGLEWDPVVDPKISARGNAQDFFQWVTLDVPAFKGTSELSLDFSEPASPTAFQGSFEVPEGDGPISQLGRAYMTVYCGGTGYEEYGEAFCGASERIDISADGSRFEYDGEYLDVPGAVSTRYSISTDGLQSYVEVFSPPSDGPQTFRHLELPEVTAPLTDELVWGETITWAARDDLAGLIGFFYVTTDDNQVGRIFVKEGGTEIRWPALPAEIVAADHDSATAYAGLFDPSFWTGITGPELDEIRQVDLGYFTLSAR